MIPKKVFFTKGVGKHTERLHSFEMALRDAGIEKFNIVSVSSIMPPGCKIISRNHGLAELKPGQIVYCVMARNETNEPNRLMAASIGCAIPADTNAYGYLSEHHPFGETEEKAGAYAEKLAATMLASTLGLEIRADKSYDEQKKEWKIQDKIVKTTNITQSALADKNGLWTTVIAAAVFICDEEGKTEESEETATIQKNNENHNKNKEASLTQNNQHPKNGPIHIKQTQKKEQTSNSSPNNSASKKSK